jgi:hypothetical protein
MYTNLYYEGVLRMITEAKIIMFTFHSPLFIVFAYLVLTYYIHLKESAFPKTMHYDLPALIQINRPHHHEIQTESNAFDNFCK